MIFDIENSVSKRFEIEIKSLAEQMKREFLEKIQKDVLPLDPDNNKKRLQNAYTETVNVLSNYSKKDPFKNNLDDIRLRSRLTAIAQLRLNLIRRSGDESILKKLYPTEIWLYISNLSEFLLRTYYRMNSMAEGLPKKPNKSDFNNLLSDATKFTHDFSNELSVFKEQLDIVYHYFFDVFHFYEEEKIESILEQLRLDEIGDYAVIKYHADKADSFFQPYSESKKGINSSFTALQEIAKNLTLAQQDSIYIEMFAIKEKQFFAEILSKHLIKDELLSQIGINEDENIDTEPNNNEEDTLVEIFKFFKEHIKKEATIKPVKIENSLNWLKDENQLEALHEELLKRGIIDNNGNSKDEFKKIFSNVIPDEPISFIWKHSDALLAYLFEELIRTNCIAKGARYNSLIERNSWFVNLNKKRIVNLKSTKQNYTQNKTTRGRPLNFQLIDDALELLK